MAQINMQHVKELRDRTQAGLNDCKVALQEADGSMEKAVEIILKKGLAKSAKRAGAVAAEGVVAARVSADGRRGVIVEINIQTDFAARNAEYLAFVEQVGNAALMAPAGADLGALPYPAGEGSIEENRQRLVARLGENITVRRWAQLEVKSGLVQPYIHMGGKVASLLALEAESSVASKPEVKAFVENTTMHIAAMSPLCLVPSDVPDAEKQKQAAIFDAQLAEEGKPEAVRGKIVEGKINKWMKEVCLLEQISVLDSEKTVGQQVQALAKEAGALKIAGFVRYERGEGIEKKEDNFALEAQKMAQE
jgi:elongation factor Ts